LRGRIGLAVEQEQNWRGDSGTAGRPHLYGIANLYYEFLDGSDVTVSGASVANQSERLTGEIGIGASQSWADDKYSLFGEVSAATGLENFADSYQLKATAGFRMDF